MNNYKIKNTWICIPENEKITPVFADIEIENGLIKKITKKTVQQFENMRIDAGDAFDVAGRVLTIPLVNFHDHLYSRLAKGLPSKDPMTDFNQILHNLWWKLDKILDQEMIKACTWNGLMESIRNGVTYIFDHHASPNSITGSLNIIKDIFKKSGVRGVLCYETSDRDGENKRNEGLQENYNFFTTETDDDIKAMLGLHASFTLSDATLKQAGELVSGDYGIHIHLCESQTDREQSLKIYKKEPVQRLYDLNVLNPYSIMVHGVDLNMEEIRLLTSKKCAIAFNPDSNLNNGVGLPDFFGIPENLRVLTGTDGMHANVARSLKQLFLLYRNVGADFTAAFNWIQKIYFDQINFVRSYFPDFPLLEEGNRADFIIWDYIPSNILNKDNFWGHFIYGVLENRIDTVVQNGKVLMQGSNLNLAEKHKIESFIVEQGRKLLQKFHQA